MKVLDIKKYYDPVAAVWINKDGFCDLYDAPGLIPARLDRYTIQYITLDCDFILTVEI